MGRRRFHVQADLLGQAIASLPFGTAFRRTAFVQPFSNDPQKTEKTRIFLISTNGI